MSVKKVRISCYHLHSQEMLPDLHILYKDRVLSLFLQYIYILHIESTSTVENMPLIEIQKLFHLVGYHFIQNLSTTSGS